MQSLVIKIPSFSLVLDMFTLMFSRLVLQQASFHITIKLKLSTEFLFSKTHKSMYTLFEDEFYTLPAAEVTAPTRLLPRKPSSSGGSRPTSMEAVAEAAVLRSNSTSVTFWFFRTPRRPCTTTKKSRAREQSREGASLYVL